STRLRIFPAATKRRGRSSAKPTPRHSSPRVRLRPAPATPSARSMLIASCSRAERITKQRTDRVNRTAGRDVADRIVGGVFGVQPRWQEADLAGEIDADWLRKNLKRILKLKADAEAGGVRVVVENVRARGLYRRRCRAKHVAAAQRQPPQH